MTSCLKMDFFRRRIVKTCDVSKTMIFRRTVIIQTLWIWLMALLCLCSFLLIQGSFSDPPTVKPSILYQCPNASANYTCHGINVSEMSWRVESFGLPVTFFPRVSETDVIVGSQYDAYYGKLISVDINEEDQ